VSKLNYWNCKQWCPGIDCGCLLGWTNSLAPSWREASKANYGQVLDSKYDFGHLTINGCIFT